MDTSIAARAPRHLDRLSLLYLPSWLGRYSCAPAAKQATPPAIFAPAREGISVEVAYAPRRLAVCLAAAARVAVCGGVAPLDAWRALDLFSVFRLPLDVHPFHGGPGEGSHAARPRSLGTLPTPKVMLPCRRLIYLRTGVCVSTTALSAGFVAWDALPLLLIRAATSRGLPLILESCTPPTPGTTSSTQRLLQ